MNMVLFGKSKWMVNVENEHGIGTFGQLWNIFVEKGDPKFEIPLPHTKILNLSHVAVFNSIQHIEPPHPNMVP
jgi:hypothetical protein